MAEYEFETWDVFTDRRFGGNPLAVFPDARGLSDADMQALGGEFNLSEITFVLPPDDPAHTARVRIFTPKEELPFAGHPNVGTALVLASRMASLPAAMTFEETAGLVSVGLSQSAAGVSAVVEAPLPLRRELDVPAALAAACAGLTPDDIRTDSHPPTLAGVGLSFVVAEVSLAALRRAAPDTGAFHAALAQTGAKRMALHLYARDGGTLRARMFAPLKGIPEDPATAVEDPGEAGQGIAERGPDVGVAEPVRGHPRRAPQRGGQRPSQPGGPEGVAVLHAESARARLRGRRVVVGDHVVAVNEPPAG